MDYLQLVNHASVLIKAGDFVLLTDPWFSGPAFSNGWELLSPNPEIDFDQVTHIWISHEHPDHFSPRSIKEFIAPLKTNPTFLYKQTSDQRVTKFLKGQGYDVIELKDGVTTQLTDSIQILSLQFGTDDSLLVVDTGDYVIVNTNDCIATRQDLKRLLSLKKLFPRIDYLLTQFALAGKVGNQNDSLLRSAESKMIRELALAQATTLEAADLIPIASFKYFSHEENFYMNEGNSTIADFYAEASEISQQMSVLYPGDLLQLGQHRESADSIEAVKRFTRDIEVARPINYEEETFSFEQLAESASKWSKLNRDFHSSILLTLLRFVPGSFSLRSIPILLKDTKVSVTLTPYGLRLNQDSNASNGLTMSSCSLMQSFSETYGGMTLMVNARFEGPTPLVKRWRLYSQLSTMRGAGIQMNLRWIISSFGRIASFLVVGRT